ncbi:MAG: hypothetical protein U0353_29655 [Sandaracinus sp.]
MRRRTALATLALSSVALWGAPTRRALAGACAGPARAVVGVVPAATDVIPRGEGVLVQILGASQRSLGAPHAWEVGQPEETAFGIRAHLARRGHRPLSLRTEIVGPGLARLVPTRAPDAGAWELVAQGESVEVTFGDGAAPPLGVAPELLAVEVHRVGRQSRPGASGGGGTSLVVTATTRSPVAAPWIGALLFSDARETDRPMLARAIEPSQGAPSPSGLVLFTTPGRCAFSPPRQSPPAVGHDVRLALYDLYGRVSARSSAVRVRERQ